MGVNMSLEIELEKQVEKNAKILQELTIQIEILNRQTDELLKELNVSHEQLTAFVGNKDAFTEDNWNDLVAQKKALDEKLLKALVNVRNPIKAKKAYQDRHVQPHWLFVR